MVIKKLSGNLLHYESLNSVAGVLGSGGIPDAKSTVGNDGGLGDGVTDDDEERREVWDTIFVLRIRRIAGEGNDANRVEKEQGRGLRGVDVEPSHHHDDGAVGQRGRSGAGPSADEALRRGVRDAQGFGLVQIMSSRGAVLGLSRNSLAAVERIDADGDSTLAWIARSH